MKMDLGLCLGGDSPVVGGSSAWSPTDGAGLLSWHNPNNASSVSTAVGDPVQDYLDLTASNIDFTQSVLAARPPLRETNGVRWLEGDGVDNAMELPSLLDFSAVSLFGLMRADNTTDNHLLGNITNTSGNPSNDQFRTYQNDLAVIISGSGFASTSNPITTGQWHVLSFLGTYGGASSLRVDGVEVATRTPFTGLTMDQLGGHWGKYFLGGIGETVSYISASMAAETITNVESYLGAYATTLNA